MDEETPSQLRQDLDTIRAESLPEIDLKARNNVLRRIIPVSQIDDVAAFNSSI